jgi:lipopolysaccharide export LptBFGC system permease protein LptF
MPFNETKVPHKWGNAPVIWGNNPFIWSDVFYIIKEIINGGSYQEGFRALSKEKKEKFIKVVLTLKGIKYEDKKTKFKKYKVTVKDIEMVIKEVKVRMLENKI